MCCVDEIPVDPAAFDHHVEDAVGQRAIAAGAHRQEEIGSARNRRHARVDDDDLRAVVARSPDIVGQDREAFADVRSGDDDGLRQRNIAPRIGRAIDAEGHLVRGAGADHAEAAVVVDIGRASATRANLPIRYAFSFVIDAPPSMANASRPYCAWISADAPRRCDSELHPMWLRENRRRVRISGASRRSG